MKRLYKQLTRKQAGVLFGAMKRGEIQLTKAFVNEMYYVADYKGYDDNGSVQDLNNSFITVIDVWFNDRANVQKQIDFVTKLHKLA